MKALNPQKYRECREKPTSSRVILIDEYKFKGRKAVNPRPMKTLCGEISSPQEV